jgi:hypothetical protein
MNEMVMSGILTVLAVLYVMRRRARLSQMDAD